MTVFEKITESQEVLGAFLAALPVMDGPWDDEFHERFCAGCDAKNCDACPNQRFRNNPGWWLNLETDGGPKDEYAVIVTYHSGARTGGIVEAESGAVAWKRALAMFGPKITAVLEVSQILTPERGGARL